MPESTVSSPATKLEVIKKAIHKFLHEKNSFTYIFELAEKYTKVSREYIFLGLFTFLAVYLVVGYGAGIIVNLLGFVYPAYKSCKAIDSVDKDDDTQWLTYWVVYAAFGIMECFTDMILFWIPFYFLLKCVFLGWCMMPMANNGSEVVYNRIIKPFVKKHEKTFDAAIDTASEAARQAAGEAISAAKNAAGNVDLKKLQKLQEMGAALSDEASKKEN